MEALDIVIMGREYRVSVKPEERDSLLAAVRYLDEKMRELAERTQSGGEKLAVMTALNIAHEYLSSQAKAGIDLPGYRRKILAMSERVDQALAAQESLF